MRARFYPIYTQTDIADREYSIKARMHVDPGGWDFKQLLYDSGKLDKDVKKEKAELDALMQARGFK
jgi:hypothetical protein